MRSRVLWVLLLVVGLSGGGTALATSQELATRGPRFLAAWAPAGHLVDASDAAALRRRVSVDLVQVRVEQALNTVINQAGLDMVFNPALLPPDRSVSLHAQDITVAAALTEVLLDTGVDVEVSRDGQLTLAPRGAAVSAVADSGDIVGTVKDSATGAPIVGATVVVEGTELTATTDADGGYRIAGVPAGNHKVIVRYIGYTQASSPVEVSSDGEVVLDLSMMKSVQQLEELVTTTPGGMQSQLKAIPSAITVITSDDIERQRPQYLNDIFRQAVPSAVGFVNPASPASTAFSMRGSSTLDVGNGQVKIVVDGIQTASSAVSPVDPASIERIEVIRGPEASTIYGPDAAGGVIQIFTKRGTLGMTRPRLTGRVELGVQETPYPGIRSVVRQKYTASVTGGAEHATYYLGASYWRLPDWLPDNEISGQTVPSISGGFHYDRDVYSIDFQGRYQVTNSAIGLNPAFLTTGLGFVSKPVFTTQEFTNQTAGIQFSVTPRTWWLNRATIGVDRSSLEQLQRRPRLTTPDDTLRQFGILNQGRLFASYNTSLQLPRRSAVSGTLTAGVDYYRQPQSQAVTEQALNIDGTINIPTGANFNVGRSAVTNLGYFGQIELGYLDRLFLTSGLRADRLSSLGKDYGVAVSPRVGLTYNSEGRRASMKLRASYGKAIRAPGPTRATSAVSPTSVTLANPSLAPERQEGVDVGLDLFLGTRGSIGITAYHQRADDLILLVTTTTTPILTNQNQNVGRVRNRGLEVEVRWNPVRYLRISGQYAYLESRIQDLGATFTGDDQVGDRPRGVPTHTAGGAITLDALSGTTLVAGVTYVGSVREYDFVAEFACFGGTGPCPESLATGSTRGFLVDLPGFAKINFSVTQRLTPELSGYLAVDNLNNNTAYEGSNFNPVQGRVTSLGFELRY